MSRSAPTEDTAPGESNLRRWLVPVGCLLLLGAATFFLAPLLLAVFVLAILPALIPGPGSVDQLQAMPEAELVYPNATRLHEGGQSAGGSITGPMSANYRLVFQTDDRPEDVFVWYADRLARPKWVESIAAYNTLDLVELHAWCSEEADVQLQIAFYDADDPRFEAGEYEVFLRATEPDYECRDTANR